MSIICYERLFIVVMAKKQDYESYFNSLDYVKA